METENKFRLNRRSALLTYPNVTENLDFPDFVAVLEQIAPIKRIVIGREIHPISGENHYHAYIEWQNKINLVGLTGRSKLLVQGFGVHVSKHRRGLDGRRYCYEYVTKDGDYWESEGFDLFPVSKNFIRDYADVNGWRHYRMVRQLKNPYPFVRPDNIIVNEPGRQEKQCNLWIIGAPSSGKTLWLNTQFANKKIYLRADSSYPYDSYQQELVIAIDDITPKLSELLYMSNVYSFPARVFGPTRYCERYLPLNKRLLIIVLTNKSIEECYLFMPNPTAGDRLRVDALYERFIVINL